MAEVDINRVFTCHHCLAEFVGRKRKYCSPACREEHAKPSYQHECQFCQKPFEGRKKKYCSPACQDEAKREADRQRALSKRQVLCCAACGVSLQKRQRKFCSLQCQRSQEKSYRDYRLEWIRRVSLQGRCGPPTFKEWEMTNKSANPYQGIDQDPTKELIERNAKDAWIYYLKTAASDEWCRRYFEVIKKPWSNPRLSAAERYRTRYRLDSKFQTKERLRRQIRKAERRNGIGDLMRAALKRNGGSPAVEQRLGYSIKDLCVHLERQFDNKMNWDLFMQGLIHIDHITPQAKFDLKDQDEWKACWSLANLRPCWAKENLKKSDKLLFLL